MRGGISPDAPPGGNAPPQRVRLVRQKHEWGCQAATFAMLTGLSYEDGCAAICGSAEYMESHTGTAYFACEHQLVEHGFAVARKYETFQPGNQKRREWPCAPFADVHWCEVIVRETSRGGHAVVMLRDGTVLDPMCDEPKRLTDYYKVNFVAGVVPLRNPPVERTA